MFIPILQSFRRLFSDPPKDSRTFNALKHHWSESRHPVVLEIDYACMWQRDPGSSTRIACYQYKDIERIQLLSDYPGGFVIAHGGFGRLHLFASEGREEVVKALSQAANSNVGITLSPSRQQITFEEFSTNRLGKYSSEESITSLTEFVVQKVTDRHSAVSGCCVIFVFRKNITLHSQ